MTKKAIIPAGTSKPIAPVVPGSMADGVPYVPGPLPFGEDNNRAPLGDPPPPTRHVLQARQTGVRAA
ncbi:pyrimidine utilization protein C, partial [Pseudomonas syringae]